MQTLRMIYMIESRRMGMYARTFELILTPIPEVSTYARMHARVHANLVWRQQGPCGWDLCIYI